MQQTKKNGRQSATLSRTPPRSLVCLSITVIHNFTEFHEYRLKTFRVIMLTLESLDLDSIFLVCRYTFGISRSSGQGQGHRSENGICEHNWIHRFVGGPSMIKGQDCVTTLWLPREYIYHGSEIVMRTSVRQCVVFFFLCSFLFIIYSIIVVNVCVDWMVLQMWRSWRIGDGCEHLSIAWPEIIIVSFTH